MINEHHRSAVFAGPRSIEIVEVPTPRIAKNQVRVRLEGCGVCGSNLPLWEGRQWFKYPLTGGAPGHEGWGVVDDVGEDVTTVRPGDRVALLAQHSFAEYDVANESDVVKLPPSLEDMPFPGEALACAVNAFRRCEIRPGQTVAVVGVGFLGALLTQLAAHAGAWVIALSRRPFALTIAKACGAAEVLPSGDPQQAIARVRTLTENRGCDCVIEATGFQAPLDLATELTAERGRLVIAGYHQDGPRQINMQLWNWRGLDVINAHERDPAVYIRGLREAVEFVDQGVLDPTPLYTHEFPLDALPEAFEQMHTRPDRFLKALITYA
jgi:threonine dehydrogenase-like Zn-dependent dehydrogenase